jgi:hypothetical protein
MADLTYQRYYASGGVVAWGTVAGPRDHLFVWKGAEPAVATVSLQTLVDQWSKANSASPGVLARSIYFCQSFDPDSSKTALGQFLGSAIAAQTWGKLAYWREAAFAGGSPIYFPDGTNTPIQAGSVALIVAGNVPNVLDDFKAIDVNGNGTQLDLTSDGSVWIIGGAAGAKDSPLSVSLQAPAGFVAGAIALSVDCPPAPASDHPIRKTRLMYQAAPRPADMPVPGGSPAQCRIWFSELTDKVEAPNAQCPIALDPRDALAAANWLGGAELNSRIEFGQTTIHSSLFSANGQRFALNAGGQGKARMGVVFDLMQDDQSIIPGTDVIFHPEGQFQIVNSGAAVASVEPAAVSPADLNIFGTDLVAGSAATEFFDLSKATHVEFVRRKPAFFLEDEGGSPSARKLFDDDGTKSLAVTSYVQFLTAGAPAAVDFHSQPAEASLFETSPGPVDSLRRYRYPFGVTKTDVPLPVFPRAGFQATSTGTDEDIFRFEASNLAQYRRNNVAPPPPPAAGLLDAPPPGAPTGKLVVTPQGLLAELNPNGVGYSRLYLGNPDSQTVRIDFSIGICNPTIHPDPDPKKAAANAAVYQDIQQALASNHLFMVFSNPSVDVLKVIAPSGTLYARDFQFAVGPAGPDSVAPCTNASVPMGATVVLVKYFTGKTMDDLVNDPGVWACQSSLAPGGNKGIKTLTGLGDKPSPATPSYLKTLEAAWFDPGWQGVLVLDLPIPVMPDILQALQPGLSSSKPALRAQHFGLNAVPARNSDLGAIPQRPGSAFGLIRYEKDTLPDPATPAMGDKEPGAAPPAPGTKDPRNYAFVVDSLQIGFENSQISTFQATVRVQFDHVFWDPVTKDDGNYKSLQLDGNYESRPLPNGKSQDVFSLVSRNPVVVKFSQPSFLNQLTVTRAQLNVASADSASGTLTAFIGIDGTLQLSETISKLPLFTVKQIRLSSFGFQFTYNNKTKAYSFGFKADGISADIDFTPGSPAPLLSLLPLKLKGMSVAIANLIDLKSDLHFQPLSLGGSNIGTKLHFGFLMELDLGSIGKLAGDLSGLRIPLLIGWAGGSNPGLAFGIQFPSFSAPIDIGIQQFIRLQAKSLVLKPCNDAANNLTAIAFQAVDARVVMFGQQWPQSDVAFVIFVPVSSNRKPSWALGVENGNWYVGGGYRISIDTSADIDVKGVVKTFHDKLNNLPKTDICTLLGLAAKDVEDWSIVGQYKGGFTVGVAISDPSIYGLNLDISGFDLDLLYRRVNGQLGIFSIEFTLPGPMRTMQFGAATVRLPVLRLEVHTDGGFLADLGFPWNNDFSRSAQVEVAIFLGSGGFYYGITAASASDLLTFTGGYGYYAPDSIVLNSIRTLRLGFAARVGIGRSFTIGILSAEASITLFGGIEGAAGYRPGEKDLFNPTLWALKGYVGLMIDISATVSFAIIQASARILAYADVGLEIRRVLVRKTPAGADHYLVTLPVVIFAEIGITVGVDVQIHIGCVSVSIHLSFSTTWRFEQTLGSISDAVAFTPGAAPQDFALEAVTAFTWNIGYKYWAAARSLTVYATVLPCMADAGDVGEAGGPKTCVVGVMMLPVRPALNGFGDLAQFLAGWALLDPGSVTGNPDDYAAYQVTLETVTDRQAQMKDPDFWAAFPNALLTVVNNQFAPALQAVANKQDEVFAVIPPWPGSVFSYIPAAGAALTGTPAQVMEGNSPMAADRAAFTEYCHHFIVGALSEIQLLIQDSPDPQNAGLGRNDTKRYMTWSQIWAGMFQKL